jgi:mRNA interferase MazF
MRLTSSRSNASASSKVAATRIKGATFELSSPGRAVATQNHDLGRPRAPPALSTEAVLSRSDALEVLHSVIVAPVTSTIRGLPSEVVVGPEHGLKHGSAINLDHVQTVRREDLKRYVATLPPEIMRRVCAALAIATGCA